MSLQKTITYMPSIPVDMIRKGHTILIASHIVGSELVFIKGNHFIANKKAKKFNRIVLEFLMKREVSIN